MIKDQSSIRLTREAVDAAIEEDAQANKKPVLVPKPPHYDPTTTLTEVIDCPCCGRGNHMIDDEMHKDVHIRCDHCDKLLLVQHTVIIVTVASVEPE